MCGRERSSAVGGLNTVELGAALDGCKIVIVRTPVLFPVAYIWGFLGGYPPSKCIAGTAF